MAVEIETEAERLTATYRSLEDTTEADALVTLQEPVLQSVEPSHSTGLRAGTLERLRRNRAKVYGALAASSDSTPQYVKADASEDLIARARLRISRGVESLPARTLAIVILAVDVLLVVIQLSLRNNFPVILEEFIEVLTLCFSAYFCGEVSLRIIGQGLVFFKRWFEVLDLLVVVISSGLTLSFILLEDHSAVDSTDGSTIITTSRLFVLGRLVRVVFWAKILYEQKSLQRFIRAKVSQNKRRYTGDGYDLDLTYVTARVIAMSFPSSGSASFYRNSIREVSQFLDQKHPGHYRVYNLCSEKEYDTSHFHHQVQRVLIDDHNVPKLTDLVDFCEDVHEWMEQDPSNIIAVHCKGGKGRTGMMVAAWLVRSGLFPQAQQSLAYFSERRTDRSRGTKNQGVETPSQSRYVCYYEQLLMELAGELPPPRPLRLSKMVISGLSGDGLVVRLCGQTISSRMKSGAVLGQEGWRDWRFEIFLMRKSIFQCSLATPDQQQVSVIFDLDNAAVAVVFSADWPLVLTDDVKFKFHSSNKSLQTGSDKCQFYFWFNTTFVQDNRLFLKRSDIDNMQKSHVWRSYPPTFSIELLFELWEGEAHAHYNDDD